MKTTQVKFRTGDMVTLNELAKSLGEPIVLYRNPPVAWMVNIDEKIGLFVPNKTATILAVQRHDELSVYIMGSNFMGWVLSAYITHII